MPYGFCGAVVLAATSSTMNAPFPALASASEGTYVIGPFKREKHNCCYLPTLTGVIT